MLTGTLFNSEYTGGDEICRSTRQNRNYIINLLGGKEWIIHGRNILSLNGQITDQGGDHYSPIDVAASQMAQEAIHNESKAFESQLSSAFLGSVTASYKLNRKHVFHEFAFKIINVSGY